LNAPPNPPLPQPLAAALSERFGQRFSVSAAVREHHGKDESSFAPQPPDGVVFALSTEDVADTVRLCAAHKVLVIARNRGQTELARLFRTAKSNVERHNSATTTLRRNEWLRERSLVSFRISLGAKWWKTHLRLRMALRDFGTQSLVRSQTNHRTRTPSQLRTQRNPTPRF
jgi:hypothetical protein